MNIEQEHAEFENWARWYALPVTRIVNDDRYESLETETAYKAWQAGRAAGIRDGRTDAYVSAARMEQMREDGL